jgi:hypothetical protein
MMNVEQPTLPIRLSHLKPHKRLIALGATPPKCDNRIGRQPTMEAHRPNRSKLQRAFKKRDKRRRNWCRRCRFLAPSGRCLDTTIRNGRCGDWVYYLRPGNKQCRRRWVRPKDPRTPAQRQIRARLSAASRKYSAELTDQELDACIAAGARRQSRPRLGQSGPLTGQQYLVRREYARNAEGRMQNAEFPAKAPRPQRVTRSTWGTHRGIAGMPPGRRGRRWRVTGSRQKVVAASEGPRGQRVPLSTRGRYRSGSVVALAQRRSGTGFSRAPRARLMRRMGVRLIPVRRPTARPCAARGRAPSARSDGGNWSRRRPR